MHSLAILLWTVERLVKTSGSQFKIIKLIRIGLMGVPTRGMDKKRCWVGYLEGRVLCTAFHGSVLLVVTVSIMLCGGSDLPN